VDKLFHIIHMSKNEKKQRNLTNTVFIIHILSPSYTQVIYKLWITCA